MKKLEHVLIVDDDREIRELVAIYLERNGMRVSHAGNAREMRAALVLDRPDLIVLDVRLPDTDGLALCRELRAATFTRYPS
ncbi:Transcriptional regulatory protein CseB [Paraburkholderia sabiae]|nr:Transcriptional regulatory protein CseB [Paraburkholderia sabiae]